MPKIALRGDRMRQLRESKGWSQGELAKLSGMGIQQIHRYESGKADATATGLKAVAIPLGVTTDYLLGLSDDPNSYAAETLRPEERQLLDAFNAGDMAAVVVLLAERVRALGGEGEKG